MTSQQEVEFKTTDGLTLRGRIFAAKERGPAVIMSPGVGFQLTRPWAIPRIVSDESGISSTESKKWSVFRVWQKDSKQQGLRL
jgi:hypothetical protein